MDALHEPERRSGKASSPMARILPRRLSASRYGAFLRWRDAGIRRTDPPDVSASHGDQGLLTLFVACLGGRETPRSAVDARKAPASPTGTALRAAFRSPPARERVSLPQRAFTGGRVRDTRHSRPKSKRRVYGIFCLSIEIVCKICVVRP